MKKLSIMLTLLAAAGAAAASELPFPNAPAGAAAFSPYIGDHACVMTYRGPEGEMDQVSKCRWNFYYKFDGHMVQDDFYMLDDDGKTLWAGTVIRTWDMGTEQWNNMFLGVHGTGFGRMFHGQPEGDEIHLSVDGEDPDGRSHMNRIYFYDAKDGAFKWRHERSYDGGETWQLWVLTELSAPVN